MNYLKCELCGNDNVEPLNETDIGVGVIQQLQRPICYECMCDPKNETEIEEIYKQIEESKNSNPFD